MNVSLCYIMTDNYMKFGGSVRVCAAPCWTQPALTAPPSDSRRWAGPAPLTNRSGAGALPGKRCSGLGRELTANG